MQPSQRLEERYSDERAVAVEWSDAVARIRAAQIGWLVTVRTDGRPHSTPVVPMWLAGKAYFHTGETEQKTRNLTTNPQVLMLVGDTGWDRGLDVVLEGDAQRITDTAVLQPLADLYADRWDGRWRLTPGGPGFIDPDGEGPGSLVFEVTPSKGFAHSKGDPFGQTNYRF